MRARPPSSSAIPSAANITAKPMPSSPPRRKPHGAPGLLAIICVGETEAQRDAGNALDVCCTARSTAACRTARRRPTPLIAYEPVWAIGTGRTPTTPRSRKCTPISAMPDKRFGEAGQGMRILYGGSVKPSNAAEILALGMSAAGLSAARA